MPPPSPPSKRPRVSSPGGRDRSGTEAREPRRWLQSAMVMGLLFCLLLSLSSITVTRRSNVVASAGGNATRAQARREKFVAGDLRGRQSVLSKNPRMYEIWIQSTG